MYCVEESKDQVQLVLQHFFFFLQANEYFNNFVGRNLARLCGF